MNKKQHTTDGLNTPAGYFDQLQENLLHRISEPESDGMSIPNNYFDTMQAKVIHVTQPKTKTKYLGILRIAAAMLVLVSGMWFYNTPEIDNQIVTESSTDYIDFLMEDIDAIELEELADIMNSDDLILDQSDDLFDFIEEEDLTIDDLIDFI